MNPLLLGLLIGTAFGAVLTLSGLSNPRLIVDMLRLKDLQLLKVLLVALGTGILGVALLSAGGFAHTSVKPLHLAAVLLGGGVFGLGFALAGYCPGTSLAAAAEGRRDAWFAVAGGLAGTAVFAELYRMLAPVLVDPWTYGKPTLFSWLGVPALAVALPLSALIGWTAWRFWRVEHPPTIEHDLRERHAH